MNTDSFMSEFKRLFDSIISGSQEFLPKLAFGLIVLLAGWLIARLFQRLVRTFVLYLNSSINEKLKNRYLKVDMESSAIFISRTFYWILLIITFAIVTQILGMTFMVNWIQGLVVYLPNILVAVIIVFVGIVSGRLVQDLIVSFTEKAGILNGIILGRLLRYTILLITIVIAIDQVGVDIVFLTNLLIIIISALLFSAGLAFGLGARDSVRNILGSYYAQKIYKAGNTVKIDDIEGQIIRITPTAVLLETKSGQISIPAKDFNTKKTIMVKND